MDVAFDPAKDSENRRKHGVPLTFGARVFEDVDHAIVPTIRPEDRESRFKAIGMVDGSLWTAVFVKREHVVRFVSVRRGNESERRNYEAR